MFRLLFYCFQRGYSWSGRFKAAHGKVVDNKVVRKVELSFYIFTLLYIRVSVCSCLNFAYRLFPCSAFYYTYYIHFILIVLFKYMPFKIKAQTHFETEYVRPKWLVALQNYNKGDTSRHCQLNPRSDTSLCVIPHKLLTHCLFANQCWNPAPFQRTTEFVLLCWSPLKSLLVRGEMCGVRQGQSPLLQHFLDRPRPTPERTSSRHVATAALHAVMRLLGLDFWYWEKVEAGSKVEKKLLILLHPWEKNTELELITTQYH